MLVVAAIFLLGIIVFSANSTILQNDDIIKDSEFGVAAISLATSLIEEVQGKVFDQAAADSGISATAQLTAPSLLGPESGEEYRTTDPSKSDFNDVDDFNRFTIEYVADTTKAKVAQYRGDAKGFRSDYFVSARVVYVTVGSGTASLNGNSAVVLPTWHKKLIVTVTSPTSRDSLVFPTVISYWN